jgi:site-specific DNA-methyltransferase (adenine-specific)
MEIDRIYNMDCLEGMKQIPDGSVDAVICDLPYGTTACAWDTVIPFEPLWEQYKRICKPNAAIVLFGAEPFSSMLRMSNIEWFKYDWYWRKPKGTGHLNAKKQPMRDVEIISVYYQQQATYNPQFSKGEPFGNKSGSKHFTSEAGETTYGKFASGPGTRNDNPGIRYPKQCIEFGVVERDTIHPTQKPVDLIAYLVRTYSNEGDTILDNCMGSGTTAIACIKEKRHYIGFELNREYFDKAVKRIQAEKSQLTLF